MGFCPAATDDDEKRQRTLQVDNNDPNSNPQQEKRLSKWEGLGKGGPWRQGGWNPGRGRGDNT